MKADSGELARLLNPLGLHEKRAGIIIRFSGDWSLCRAELFILLFRGKL